MDENVIEAKSKYHYYKQVLFFSFAVACTITIPFIIVEWIKTGHPVFLYYGDYNAQQLCFYRHCVEMVQSGAMRWDWVTDIGSNFVGSYSYYMLGSPFFWIMCLFPSSFAPYLMGPIYILKYITASLIAFAYLQRFTKNKNYAVIGALLYAFCGFQIYNTFFNQFHEVVTLFPLLLLGMEELVNNNRRGLFAVAVALNAVCNYFMFAGQVAFCIFYFLFRFICRDFKITLKRFGLLAFEAVLGVVMSLCLFLPGGLALLGNTRVDRHFSSVLNMLVYLSSNKPYWYRYGHILESFFFPPDIPSRTNFFYGHGERWSSNAIYVPMFGLTGLFALIRTKKTRTWLKVFCIFLSVCCFVPVLNSSFFLFNSSYYARWVYMLTLMLVLATVIALDNAETRWKGAVLTYLAASAAIFIPIGLRWYDNLSSDDVGYTLGSEPFPVRLWLCVLVVAVSCGMMWYLFTKLRGSKNFDRGVLISVCCVIVLYSAIHITNGKQHSWSSSYMVNQALNGDVVLDDNDFYRIDFYRDSKTSTLDNLGIYWEYPSIECFHTVVPASIMEFYPQISVTRNVGSRPDTELYGLRGFTSVKYSFVESKSSSKNDIEGWAYYDTQNGFDIYLNENYVDMGFYYTEFMVESEFKKVSSSERNRLLCTYLVVPDEMSGYYERFMTRVDKKDAKKASYDTYTQSVAQLREQVCSSFEYDSAGFTATIELDAPQIVTFSVPRDKTNVVTLFGREIDLGGGWVATVNGREADVLDVTYGFMAVECGEGENTIEFSYTTPGLKTGLICTGIGILILLAYLLISRRRGQKATYKFFSEDYYSDDSQKKPEIDEAAESIIINYDAQTDETAETAETAAESEDASEIHESPTDESPTDETPEDAQPEDAQPEGARRKDYKLPKWGWWLICGAFVIGVLVFVLAIMYYTVNVKINL